ncbi:MAG TPA: hypothetical protein VFZ32_02960 [Micromonosporaceae bacterium]
MRHRLTPVEFRLLTEHEDHGRGVNVLRASTDAINALVGGLEFDVEDEQAVPEWLPPAVHGGRDSPAVNPRRTCSASRPM